MVLPMKTLQCFGWHNMFVRYLDLEQQPIQVEVMVLDLSQVVLAEVMATVELVVVFVAVFVEAVVAFDLQLDHCYYLHLVV